MVVQDESRRPAQILRVHDADQGDRIQLGLFGVGSSDNHGLAKRRNFRGFLPGRFRVGGRRVLHTGLKQQYKDYEIEQTCP